MVHLHILEGAEWKCVVNAVYEPRSLSSSGQRAYSTKLSTSAVFRTLICCRAQWAGERALKANNINDFTPVDP